MLTRPRLLACICAPFVICENMHKTSFLRVETCSEIGKGSRSVGYLGWLAVGGVGMERPRASVDQIVYAREPTTQTRYWTVLPSITRGSRAFIYLRGLGCVGL